MFKTILTCYLLGVIGLSHAQDAMTEMELIEFLGEFDEEDELILEKAMTNIEQGKINTSKQNEATEVHHDVTND